MRKFTSILLSLVFLLASPAPLEAETTITGKATWYQCTAGWCDGTPTIALAGFLGGRYTGHVNGYVEVCGDRCVVLPSVDYCQCYEGTADERIVDLNRAAWPLVTDQPYATGKITVTITLDVDQGISTPLTIPDTATSKGSVWLTVFLIGFMVGLWLSWRSEE